MATIVIPQATNGEIRFSNAKDIHTQNNLVHFIINDTSEQTQTELIDLIQKDIVHSFCVERSFIFKTQWLRVAVYAKRVVEIITE